VALGARRGQLGCPPAAVIARGRRQQRLVPDHVLMQRCAAGVDQGLQVIQMLLARLRPR
jgi:hypothetical protein